MRCRQPLPLLLCLLFCQPAWAQVSPESAEKYNAGQELFEKRRYQQALQAFEEAVKLDGNNAQAYRGMAKTYQKLKDTDKAIGNFRMAATVKPDYVEANYELGNLYFNLKKYKDAQEAFKKGPESGRQLSGWRRQETPEGGLCKAGQGVPCSQELQEGY